MGQPQQGFYPMNQYPVGIHPGMGVPMEGYPPNRSPYDYNSHGPNYNQQQQHPSTTNTSSSGGQQSNTAATPDGHGKGENPQQKQSGNTPINFHGK